MALTTKVLASDNLLVQKDLRENPNAEPTVSLAPQAACLWKMSRRDLMQSPKSQIVTRIDSAALRAFFGPLEALHLWR